MCYGGMTPAPAVAPACTADLDVDEFSWLDDLEDDADLLSPSVADSSNASSQLQLKAEPGGCGARQQGCQGVRTASGPTKAFLSIGGAERPTKAPGTGTRLVHKPVPGGAWGRSDTGLRAPGSPMTLILSFVMQSRRSRRPARARRRSNSRRGAPPPCTRPPWRTQRPT